MIYLQLFASFFMIAVFNFGGGYAMLSLIQNEVVTKHAWLTLQEFTNILAVTESTPGPFAVNTATYTGYKIAGILGAVVANVAILLPALIIIIIIARYLFKNQNSPFTQGILKGLRPVTVALIVGAAISLSKDIDFQLIPILLGLLAFYLSFTKKLHPALIVIGLGIIGAFFV